MTDHPPQTPADVPQPTPEAMRAAREFIRAAKATPLPSDPSDDDVALLLASTIDRETGLPALLAMLRESEDLLRECDRTLAEHHNAALHDGSAPMFDKNNSCKVCGEWPNNIFGRLSGLLHRLRGKVSHV